MAAGTLAAPGTKYGPCKKECKHTDCTNTRQMAESICPECKKPIGYETRFYKLHKGELLPGSDFEGLVHAACIETYEEAI